MRKCAEHPRLEAGSTTLHRAVSIRAVPAALMIAVLTACQAPVAEDSVPGSPSVVTLTGKITSAGGHQLLLSHAHLHDMTSMTHETSVQVEADGSFALEVPTDRFFELRATAVDHEMSEIPLILEGESRVEIQVALKPTKFVEPFEEVRMTGHWGQEGKEKTVALEKLDDGTYRHLLEGLEGRDHVRYQLLGIAADGRAVNGNSSGTSSDGFEYDGGGDFYTAGGDYYSLAPVTEGRAEIIFDPASLPPPAEGPRVSTTSASIQGVMELVREIGDSTDELKLLYSAAKASGVPIETLEQERAELMADAVEIARALTDDEQAPAVLRSYAAARFLGLAEHAKDTRKRALAHLPASSIYWVVAPDFPRSLMMKEETAEEDTVEEDAELISALRTENPSPLVRGSALARLTELAKEAGDTEEWAHLYTELQTKYGHIRGLAYPLEVLNPNKPIKTGLPVPELKLTLLNGHEVSKETLKGSYVLLDFWATWCAPCVAKMPEVERTWAAHKDKSFQILSISFDSSREDILPFRAKRFAMPWLHAHVENGFESELAEAFGVQSIPQPVLMDPDGIVVATEETLGRKNLYATITAHLESSAK